MIMLYALSLAALTSAFLRTLLLVWLLRSNARLVRRNWSTVADPSNLRIHAFVLCNLMYLGTWLVHSLTLLVEIVVETLLSGTTRSALSTVIFCDVVSAVCAIGAAFHVALCFEQILDPVVRFVLEKWDPEERDAVHRKVIALWLVCAVPMGSVVVGKIGVDSSPSVSGQWEYTEIARGEEVSASLSYGIELVVCTAKTRDKSANLLNIAEELGAVLILTGVCFVLRLFYETWSKRTYWCTAEDTSGWRCFVHRTLHPVRWMAASVPAVTTLWLLAVLPLLRFLVLRTNSSSFYPEVGVHLLLMLSAILVATSQDTSQKLTAVEIVDLEA